MDTIKYIKLTSFINHDGVDHPIGRIIPMESGQADRLIKLNCAVKCDKPVKAQSVLLKLLKVNRVDKDIGKSLIQLGLHTYELLSKASIDDLCTIRGVGSNTAKSIIKSAKGLLNE